MSAGKILLWIILPYAAAAIFDVGHWWRYRTDQFDWTSRSTQLLDRRILGWASPAFHYAPLAAVGGHIIGLLIPASVANAIGIDRTPTVGSRRSPAESPAPSRWSASSAWFTGESPQTGSGATPPGSSSSPTCSWRC